MNKSFNNHAFVRERLLRLQVICLSMLYRLCMNIYCERLMQVIHICFSKLVYVIAS